jgi:hypothetical protein
MLPMKYVKNPLGKGSEAHPTAEFNATLSLTLLFFFFP